MTDHHPWNAHPARNSRIELYDAVVLDGIRWDGTKRLDTWLTTYLSAEDSPLNRAFGRLTLIAAVRRVRQPGCKFDHILVFEGPEGTQKSGTIALLALDARNFSDQTILGLSDRQQQELLRGKWLYEIAEMHGMKRADVDAVKAFASRTMIEPGPLTDEASSTSRAAAFSSEQRTTTNI